MEEKLSVAEEEINKLPVSGKIKLTFVRICPTLKSIHKYIPLSFMSKKYKEVYDDLSNSGIFLKLEQRNIKISDYYKFICKLFPSLEVKDCQAEKVGKPDFFLLNKETEFYLEVKNSNDGLRFSQMDWIANNKHKEIWVLFINSLFVDQFGRSIAYEDN
jgi:hypothetical protein